MRQRKLIPIGLFPCALTAVLVMLTGAQTAVAGYRSADGTLSATGFVDSATFVRKDEDLTKQRLQAQLEFGKLFRPRGIFSELSMHGTFRASYDAVYDINDDTYGSEAGGPVSYSAPGNPAFFAFINGGATPPPFTLADVPTSLGYAGTFGPLFANPAFDGAIPLPATGGTINSASNPNEGLRLAASDVYGYQDGGVILATPVRPCDVDSRGCRADYFDKTKSDLEYREFNDDWDFIRELYIDAAIPLFRGRNELALRVGRQQVVWGRTDLFRVLDVVNPMDFSRQNLYAEFEDSRIPMGMVNAEYRFGATNWFEDLNVQFLWKFEQFRPHDLGQGGEPYAILGAGNFFRAFANCWDNGCTVGNFPVADVAVEFPAQAIGIRNVNRPDHTEVGGRIEGVFKGVGFSLNALYFYSQFPSLRGGIESINPFLDPMTPNAPTVHPYSLAFDIEFPRLFMVGGSVDWYWEFAKSSFRVETSYTTDEEFADTSKASLYSDSDVFRWVIGFDRPTFIPFLNRTRAFLISGQIFGQHLLDHESYSVNSAGIPTMSQIGFQDWEDNYIVTLLIQGNYFNDRVTPQIITAYDTEAEAGVISPSVEWKPSNNWVVKFALNLKWADDTGAIAADDNRAANPYPPFTCAPPLLPPATVPPSAACFSPYSSLGAAGFEPLGRFRSGPIGAAHNEDEVQLTVRYQF